MASSILSDCSYATSRVRHVLLPPSPRFRPSLAPSLPRPLAAAILNLRTMSSAVPTASADSGCMELLCRYGVETKGKRAVAIGRSNIVGMPAALLLQAYSYLVDAELNPRLSDLGSPSVAVLALGCSASALLALNGIKPKLDTSSQASEERRSFWIRPELVVIHAWSAPCSLSTSLMYSFTQGYHFTLQMRN